MTEQETSTKKITIFPKFSLGDTVFLKIREEREPGMVTGIVIKPDSYLNYCVTWQDGCEHTHYELELTDTYEPSYEPGT